MNRQSFSPGEDGYIREILEYIRKYLVEKKVSKANIIKTELLAEETIVLLAKHAPKGSKLHVSATKTLGDVYVELSMKGEEFNPSISISDITGLAQADATDDEIRDSSESEDAIRSILLNAFGEKYKYSHLGNINRVRIIAEQSGKATLYSTLLAMVSGLIFGALLNAVIPQSISDFVCQNLLRPVKTMFMSAITIIIAPVVFFSLVSCISQFKNLAELGKMAAKIMAVYVITTMIATALGMSIMTLIKPGEWGFALGKEIATDSISLPTGTVDTSVVSMIMNIVPNNLLKPFVEANTLQVMFLAILIGTAVGMIGKYSATLVEIFEACNSLFLTITTMIARLIPIAVFCSVALMIVNMGGKSFLMVIEATVVQCGTVLIMICIYGLLVLVAGRFNPVQFYKNIKEGMLTSFSLSSSSAAMPTNLKICTDKLGISPKLCNFSIPLGATVNMDGTCIYLSTMTLFLARAYGVEVTPSMMVSMVIMIILLSLGAPGVPGCALICMGVLLVQIGVPVEAMGLIIAVNPISDMFDTMNNTTGDMAASLIVARMEHLVDTDIFNAD